MGKSWGTHPMVISRLHRTFSPHYPLGDPPNQLLIRWWWWLLQGWQTFYEQLFFQKTLRIKDFIKNTFWYHIMSSNGHLKEFQKIFWKSLVKVSVSTTFVQSRWVSVSTTTKLASLDESRSRQLRNFLVSMSLGLDNLRKSESRKVSVSRLWKFESRSRSRWRDQPVGLDGLGLETMRLVSLISAWRYCLVSLESLGMFFVA